jgi:hypothetical protein
MIVLLECQKIYLIYRPQKNMFRQEMSSLQLFFVQWMSAFLESNVERLPNKVKDIFHLPGSQTKLEFYKQFKDHSIFCQEAMVDYSWFCRLWLAKFIKV